MRPILLQGHVRDPRLAVAVVPMLMLSPLVGEIIEPDQVRPAYSGEILSLRTDILKGTPEMETYSSQSQKIK